LAILHAVFPLAFIAVAIGPLVNTVAILLAILPIANTAVAVGPLFNTVAIFLAVFPIANIAVAVGPLLNTVAIFHAVLPIANIAVAIGDTANPRHAALTVFLPVFQLAFVDAFRKDLLFLRLLPFYLSLIFITCYFPV
jgi:hypothetical protein